MRLKKRASDSGQACVELALAMPVLWLLLLGIVQVVVVMRDQLVVIDAARVGARAAAVSASPSSASQHAASEIAGSSARVHTDAAGELVRVTVQLTNPTDVPLIGVLIPDVVVSFTATMLVEPP